MSRIPLLTLENAAGLIRHTTDCLGREYPNTLGDSKPRLRHPAFYGCFDWHSSVHGHWAMVRLLKLFPDSGLARDLQTTLGSRLTSENIAGEIETLSRKENYFFECPYGWSWFLYLCAELQDMKSEAARLWSDVLSPLEQIIAERSREYFTGLSGPIRHGVHSNSAFSLALMIDYARAAGDRQLSRCLCETSRRFYSNDTACPAAYEPSANDFLSPCLAEAETMRRVLDAVSFREWFNDFLPSPITEDQTKAWSPPPPVGHLIGLTFHRAWCFEALASVLEEEDPRRPSFRVLVEENCAAGLEALGKCGYEGTHWLATFAIYFISRAWLRQREC